MLLQTEGSDLWATECAICNVINDLPGYSPATVPQIFILVQLNAAVEHCH